MDCILINQSANIMVNAGVLKDLPYFNAKIKVGEVNKIERLANKKVRESETGPVIMPTGTLLAAGKIKRKYAKI